MKKIIFSLSTFISLSLSLATLATLAAPSKNPNEVWAQIQGGWQGVYSDLMDSKLDPRKNYVVWSMIAPKKPLDLRKADFFRDFLAHNSAKGISISHNLVAWSCRVPGGQHYMGATGHSGERSGQTAKMVKDGFGLTAFLATHTDGWLSSSRQTAKIWSERGRGEDIYNLVVEISENDCANMMGFLKKFVFSPNKPFTKFGFRVDPEKYQGGGCISFAAAMLKKAGVLKQMLNATERTLYANPYRFGGNLPVPNGVLLPKLTWLNGKSHTVWVDTFFRDTWNGGTKGIRLDLYDPELMIWGLKNLSSSFGGPRKVQKYPTNDPTINCKDQELPECNYRTKLIDNAFDSQAPKVANKASSWRKSMIGNGYRASAATLQGEKFVIFQRN